LFELQQAMKHKKSRQKLAEMLKRHAKVGGTSFVKKIRGKIE
jgi:hypothetical protein